MRLAQTQLDRPPEGLARGRWPAPRWAIAALGAAVLVGALIYLALRLRRSLRGKG
ncbi:MAG TPA: hypothetical protein VE093_24890 [Polyangiaceae bacterium]|nr:hypothetical protein [Polyangiaceae bacterium]